MQQPSKIKLNKHLPKHKYHNQLGPVCDVLHHGNKARVISQQENITRITNYFFNVILPVKCISLSHFHNNRSTDISQDSCRTKYSYIKE